MSPKSKFSTMISEAFGILLHAGAKVYRHLPIPLGASGVSIYADNGDKSGEVRLWAAGSGLTAAITSHTG
jgi:hypothetical protein